MSKYLGTKGRKDRLWRFSNPRLGVEILLFAGAHRGPSRGFCMSEYRSVRRQTVAPSARRSISNLLDEVSESELEQFAIEVILQNRRHLERAQTLFEKIDAQGPEQENDQAFLQLRHAYHLALITLNGHHHVVSAVVNALGYVPNVPDDAEDNNSASARLN